MEALYSDVSSHILGIWCFSTSLNKAHIPKNSAVFRRAQKYRISTCPRRLITPLLWKTRLYIYRSARTGSYNFQLATCWSGEYIGADEFEWLLVFLRWWSAHVNKCNAIYIQWKMCAQLCAFAPPRARTARAALGQPVKNELVCRRAANKNKWETRW